MIPRLRAHSDSASSRIRARHNALPQAVQSRTRRLYGSLLPIVQCSLAAGLAWYIAHDVIRHVTPFFAPIAAVISLGLSLNQRLRRSLELVGGVTLGIGIADLLIQLIGTGVWQIVLVVALAMGAAVLVDRGPLVPMQAASSAVLVATLLPPGSTGGVYRMIDAAIGGLVGVTVAALIPNHPVRRPRRDAAKVLDTLRRVVQAVADGLQNNDRSRLDWALESARATQPDLDQLRTDLAGGVEIAKVSPVFWSARARMERLAAIAEPLDNAVRNVRVMARRAAAAHQDGEQVSPEVIEQIRELGGSFRTLREMVLADPGEHPDQADAARTLRSAARRVAAVEPGPGLSETVIYAQLRSAIVDLLQVAGLQRTSALAVFRDLGRRRGRDGA
ncbi:FUSC family protein [Tsukamurella sp. 8F]|uniref:FUSC family protein n=1 Tax=unclassified Tsukamurella TaxID=2633480 RepID=UPI0023B892F8|nr:MULTISPECIES: FUSC family protein [unclassified Tsukamurella]MDF0530956.1 FUSC family protein [Tsukamurella sp. 8J]MDF0588281.1 FUSC family protein [Tsukamurella sp. 8F]